jgi:hypothetical protein
MMDFVKLGILCGGETNSKISATQRSAARCRGCEKGKPKNRCTASAANWQSSLDQSGTQGGVWPTQMLNKQTGDSQVELITAREWQPTPQQHQHQQQTA